MEDLTYLNVSAEVWERFKANVSKDTGLPFLGNEGTGKAHGIDYSYSYDPATLTLHVKETRSFYDPSDSVIAKEINEELTKSR